MKTVFKCKCGCEIVFHSDNTVSKTELRPKKCFRCGNKEFKDNTKEEVVIEND